MVLFFLVLFHQLFQIGVQATFPVQSSIYSDDKATAVNDIVTVLILEDTSASSTASTELRNTTEKERGIQEFFGLSGRLPLRAAANSSSRHEDSGAIDRNGKIRAVLSAKVTEVLENGSLVLEGTKEITINGHKASLWLKGVARPENIDFQNTVLSSAIANLEIRYEGAEDKKRGGFIGAISRVLDWLWIF